MDEPIVFIDHSADSADIRDLIRNEGDLVCRNTFHPEYIRARLNEADFGYAVVSLKAQVGRRSIRKWSDRHCLSGFALARILDVPRNVNPHVFLDLVCSRKNYTTGQLLVESIAARAETLGLKSLRLLSLPHLENWYGRLGFLKVQTIHDQDKGTPKVVEMVMTLRG